MTILNTSFLMCANMSAGYISRREIAELEVNVFVILIDVSNLPSIGVTAISFPSMMYQVPVFPQVLQQSEYVVKPLDFCQSNR